MKAGTVICDPPWDYTTWSKKNQTRSASTKYAVLDIKAIQALPVASCMQANSVLLLWCTWPMLELGIQTMNKWGIKYKTGFPWVKMQRADLLQLGTGYHARAVSEVILIGTLGRGFCPPPALREAGVVIAPPAPPLRPAEALLASAAGSLIHPRSQVHSAKPDEQYRRAELYKGPYLEVFSRQDTGLLPPRPGWTHLGDAIDGLDIREALPAYAASKTSPLQLK